MLDSPAYQTHSSRFRHTDQQNTANSSPPFRGRNVPGPFSSREIREGATVNTWDQNTEHPSPGRLRNRHDGDIEPALRMINYETSSAYSQSVLRSLL